MRPVAYWDNARAELSTPELVDLRLEMANVGSRGLALMVDLAIRYGVFFILYLILSLTTHSDLLATKMSFSLKGFTLLLIFIVFVSEWFYFTLFEWLWNGQTPGKRLLHLRVIKEDGSPVTWLEVVLRNFTRPIDTSGPMALVGLAFIFFQPRAQRPGDLAARTIVIRETTVDWKNFFPEAESFAESTVTRPPIRLDPAELEILQRYLQRAPELAAKRREELAALIRARLSGSVRGTELDRSPLSDHDWLKEVGRRS